MTIKVLVVDDQALVRTGFRKIPNPNQTSRSSAKSEMAPRRSRRWRCFVPMSC